MIKPIGPQFAAIVSRLEIVHEALAKAQDEGRRDVQQACGRLCMEQFSGRNRNVDADADWALVRDYLQGPLLLREAV